MRALRLLTRRAGAVPQVRRVARTLGLDVLVREVHDVPSPLVHLLLRVLAPVTLALRHHAQRSGDSVSLRDLHPQKLAPCRGRHCNRSRERLAGRGVADPRAAARAYALGRAVRALGHGFVRALAVAEAVRREGLLRLGKRHAVPEARQILQCRAMTHRVAVARVYAAVDRDVQQRPARAAEVRPFVPGLADAKAVADNLEIDLVTGQLPFNAPIG